MIETSPMTSIEANKLAQTDFEAYTQNFKDEKIAKRTAEAAKNLFQDTTEEYRELGIINKDETNTGDQRNNAARRMDELSHPFKKTGELLDKQQDFVKYAGESALQSFRTEQSVEDAARNYRENNGAYQDAAVAEAALDGVHMNVEQPTQPEETVEVHKV